MAEFSRVSCRRHAICLPGDVVESEIEKIGVRYPVVHV